MKSHHVPLAGSLLLLASMLGLCAAGQSGVPVKPPLVISSMYGPDLFGFYCASCHGRDGTGNGPVAAALKSRPPDLTALARRNGGVFPETRVRSVLNGTEAWTRDAHGPTEMPVWGRIFRALDPDDRRGAVRLSNIVAYLASVQATSAERLVWREPSGRLTPDAREALSLLTRAGEEGLDPDDYDAADLRRAAERLERAGASFPDPAAFDQRLTSGVVRYLHDLHEGRVDPRALGFRMNAPPDGHDFGALVAAAVADHRLLALFEEFTPRLALYRNLRSALARYRLLPADSALDTLPAGRSVHPGDSYPAAPILRRRLVAFGDMADDSPAAAAAAPVYAGPLVDGVARFQRRHGLEPDGVLGPETQAALNVAPSSRVRQLELALERLRWLPHLEDRRFIAVNIPIFRLWAWDGLRPDGVASFQSGVIVGRALNTRTPVFVEELREVVFRPYWNVPSSIVRHEILPAMARQPDYLARHDMEVISSPGQPLRVRQRPGPSNALGLIKFVFPNDDDVYMHGTPAPALFARARRDFSHGCVRVEDPVGLAQWVLGGQPEWTRDRIVEAMNGPASQRVELSRPIRVILFYLTAVVTPEDGAVHFATDIYGHDARLDRMLVGDRRRFSGSTPH